MMWILWEQESFWVWPELMSDKVHLNKSSAKCRPCCLGLNVLKVSGFIWFMRIYLRQYQSDLLVTLHVQRDIQCTNKDNIPPYFMWSNYFSMPNMPFFIRDRLWYYITIMIYVTISWEHHIQLTCYEKAKIFGNIYLMFHPPCRDIHHMPYIFNLLAPGRCSCKIKCAFLPHFRYWCLQFSPWN